MVQLENTWRRFSDPGEAPDVALYIGWSKLRSYEDAFNFRPGAIGYHVASAEAVSTRNSTERGWCRNALLRGVTITLGLIGESNLDAFPDPARWISLLLSGRYSLVKAYYYANRYVSWRMTLFGDSLYNPWYGRITPRLAGDADLPVPPADHRIDDPIVARDSMKREQDLLCTKLAQILREVVRHTQTGP